MKRHNIRAGLYEIFWASGGSSLAAIGVNADGTNWVAPTNWVSPTTEGEKWAFGERNEFVSIQELKPISPSTGFEGKTCPIIRDRDDRTYVTYSCCGKTGLQWDWEEYCPGCGGKTVEFSR